MARAPTADQRAAHLTLLAVYRRVEAALEMNTRMAVRDARRAGASFAEIAAARGVSRQAVRQEHNRIRAKVKVELSGGPRDGQARVETSPGHQLRYMEYEYYSRRDRREVVVYSTYTKKYGDPSIYEFTALLDDQGRPASAEPPPEPPRTSRPLDPAPTPAGGPPATEATREARAVRAARGPGAIRVHELAKELGLTSKQVLAELETLGQYVKSASSLLEHPVAEKVRRSRGPGLRAPTEAGPA